MAKTIQTFPEKLIPLRAKIQILAPKPLGPTAKIFVRETARNLEQYNQKIKCEANGRDLLSGKKIAVNTVGRWLFGAPGFQGNTRIVPFENTITIYYSEKSPTIARNLLEEIKKTIETKIL